MARALLCLAVVILLALPSPARPQVALDCWPEGQQGDFACVDLDAEGAARSLPRSFRSWSLFLVCNPSWLEEQTGAGSARVASLYEKFRSFGRAIGPDNAAIWFTRNRFAAGSNVYEPSIASEFCSRFGLVPSEGPYILVTTQHPAKEEAGANKVVVSLKGLNPARITEITDKVTDQIVAKKLSQQEIDSEVYWASWKSVADTVWDTLGGELKKIKITIDAKFVKAEYSGGS